MARIKVRARAVDMLGRQQIAGIPTAIHELFKNAHDAYAAAVEVDHIRADQLLIVRDDGLGMTRNDFETRWLTLGTESKVGANAPGAQAWTGPNSKVARPIMGEKGIGRLAIAAIGPQVLILSRAIRPDGLHPLVVSLVNWRLFEVPGLDLDNIEIPIVEIPSGEMPDRTIIQSLVDRISENLDNLGTSIPADIAHSVRTDLALMNFDPGAVQAHLSPPYLDSISFGTHFYIRPCAQILSDDIDSDKDDAASPLEKMLLGFSNTMMPETASPVIKAEFRDHKEDGRVKELIGGNAFFTPAEFIAADHHVEGEFDAYGQFTGSVAVYNGEPVVHTIPWPGSTGKPTDCGPFRIKFAYLQGRLSESRLPPEQFAQISQKLNRIGGLYVYRDGIRILPYGNSDFDFLNIERRRTKSAQDWFFSYRRIFGAVEISYQSNSALVEKAGREGFRANRAYREFVAILENFFERLAIDFFRPTSTYGDEFNTKKADFIREAKALEKREKHVKERRRKLSIELNNFFTAIERGEPTDAANALRADLTQRLSALKSIADIDLAAQQLLSLEVDGREALQKLRDRYTIGRPRGFGMTKVQQKDWAAYLRNFDRLEAELFGPLRDTIDALVTDAAQGSLAIVDRRRRIVAGLDSRRRSATLATSKLRKEVGAQVKQLSEVVDDTLRECVTRLGDDIANTFADLGRTDTYAVDEFDLRALQHAWETRIEASSAETQERLSALRDQLQSVATAVERDEFADDATAALESQSETYRSQLDDYAELAQVGMALGIVQHEFQSTANAINEAISKLQPWSRANADLANLVRDVSGGFEHLEGYLRLFTPMSRRLNRDVVELTGEQIRIYLDEVFGDRIRRHNIEMRWTKRFDVARVRGFASTFLPAFVNVVDNALFWVTFDRDAERWIELDAIDDAFLITNGGPGIEMRVADRIFDFGESTKPNGRGMGLYISRQALNKEGYDLSLETAGREVHPTFRIEPMISTEAETAVDEDGE
jgi:hypothetical protein